MAMSMVAGVVVVLVVAVNHLLGWLSDRLDAGVSHACFAMLLASEESLGSGLPFNKDDSSEHACLQHNIAVFT
jgi:hypothetical protein